MCSDSSADGKYSFSANRDDRAAVGAANASGAPPRHRHRRASPCRRTARSGTFNQRLTPAHTPAHARLTVQTAPPLLFFYLTPFILLYHGSMYGCYMYTNSCM